MRVRLLALTAVAVGAIGIGAIVSPLGGASAAAPKPVNLGKGNETNAITGITNTAGVALRLTSAAGKAPFSTNNRGTVTNLSADLLDGHSTGYFARSTAQTGTIIAFNAPAVCPASTTMVGGGGYVPGGSLSYSGPAITGDGGFAKSAWQAYAPNFTDDAYSFAQCFQPNGTAVVGSIQDNAAKGKLTADQKAFMSMTGKKAKAGK